MAHAGKLRSGYHLQNSGLVRRVSVLHHWSVPISAVPDGTSDLIEVNAELASFSSSAERTYQWGKFVLRLLIGGSEGLIAAKADFTGSLMTAASLEWQCLIPHSL